VEPPLLFLIQFAVYEADIYRSCGLMFVFSICAWFLLLPDCAITIDCNFA